MRDTQRNIKQYKEQLKFIKEKLLTTVLLFLVACTMMTTTTFAWIVLSVNPEVKGITTSVSGNGNLEIALASSDEDGTAKVPETAKAGDSKKDILEKNITWGNLVNLNDDGYGLSNIVLRPSTLNRTDVLQSPLLAVEYSSDGRILRKSFEFSYANYDSRENKYLISDVNQYGVRAISSVTKEVSGQAAIESYNIYTALKQKLEDSKSLYREIVNDSNDEPAEKRYLSVIADLMGVFLTDKLNDSDTTIDSYLPSVYNMVYDFTEAMRLLGETYVEMANIQILKNNSTYTPFTLKTLLNQSESSLANTYSIKVMDGFDEFKTNYNRLIKEEDGFYDEETKTITDASKGGVLQHVRVYKSMSGVKMSQLQGDIDFLVNINSCVIDDKYTIGGMASMGMGELMGMLSGTHKGTIVKGALKDYEQLTGEKMDARNMSIKAKYITTVTVKANISTNAAAPFIVPTEIDGDGTGTDGDNSILGILFKNLDMIETAGDIYGMSLDLWLRTNVSDSYLVLEGEPIKEYHPLTNNNGYYVYIDKTTEDKYYHIPDTNYPAPTSPDVTLDYIPEGSTQYLEYGTFYSYVSNQEKEFTTHDEEGNIVDDPIARKEFISNLKYAQKTIVIGYDGVNRVWEETSALIDGTSTTQGKGSCFIFYPEDPIEQDRMLKLLNALTVAFIDSNGNILTTASLNSENAYEEAGKITVPLELNETDSTIILDDNGNEIYTITALEQNADTFISAVVYLDGELIGNQDVSETKNINGYLNLQFGSTEKLNPQDDEKLQQEYIVVSGSVDRDSFTAEELPARTNLTINVAGTEANEVKVNFIRRVSNFQGVKMDDLDLTLVSSSEKASTWTASQEFINPGTYVLRNVWVDDIEYDLEEEISVEVPGLDIVNVGWNQSANEIYTMSSDNFYNIELTAKISASELLEPTKVEGLFKNEYNEYVTINMTNNGSVWVGEGKFTSSGTYTLEFLRIDGELYYIDDSMQKIVHLSLGIYAEVELEKTKFDWNPSNRDENVVAISKVQIFDNKGNAIENLSNTTIHYALSGNLTNTLSSPLEWHEGSRTYRGNFKVINPGVYEFNKISISTADSVSEIRTADAQTLIAISPFSIELVEDSIEQLTADYQFAPDSDAKFSVKINNSSSSTVAAKVLNVNNGQTYYFVAPNNKATTEIINEETGESVTTWSFYPLLGLNQTNDLQDGTWKLEEILVTNAYYNGVFYSQSEGNWWEGSENSYVKWDVEDVTTHIMNDIYISVKNSGHVNNDDFSGNVNESLSGQYQVSGYTITYTDYFKQNIFASNNGEKTVAEKFNISLNSNTLQYTYSCTTGIIGDSGYWKQLDGKTVTQDILQSEISKQTVDFVNNKTFTFYYPGQYESKTSIVMTIGTTEYSLSVNTSGDYSKCFVVDYSDITTEQVGWVRPDIIFSGTTPAVNTSFNAWSSGMKSVKNSIDSTGKVATIFTPAVNHTTESSCVGSIDKVTFEAPGLTMKLVNLTNHDGVTCIIDNTRNGDYFKTDPTFTFATNSQTASAKVAADTGVVSELVASSVNYNKYRIGDNDAATDFTVTIKTTSATQHTYNFTLNGNLSVNYAY